MSEPILRVENLQTYFPIKSGFFEKTVGHVKAVDGVSFEINSGETFGLVGESGCGKTTTGKTILRIFGATGGKVYFHGEDITSLSEKEFHKFRRKIQIIFQDPYGSLDPRQSAGTIIRDTIVADGEKHSKEELNKRVDELLKLVELDPEMKTRYPHEMSGGQRQRLGIARALACNPELIICDEPVSALDVSIQAQIINLFMKLQKQLGIAYLFIAHDLAVVQHIAKNIGVMYLGHIVEVMPSSDLYDKPMHPYTRALLSAVPTTDYKNEKKRTREILQGEVPSPTNAPSGCPFNPRCKYACKTCQKNSQKLKEVSKGHSVACYRVAKGEISYD